MSRTVLPEVFLRVPGTPWADPAVEVGSWQVDRELVGNTLPGNVRARSGLSVGSASATIAQAVGKPLAPWALGSRRVVSAGQPCALYADGPIPLGEWRVAPTSGALTSAEVSVELVEAQSLGKQPNRLPAAESSWLADPAWMLHMLARDSGFPTTTPLRPGLIAAVPFTGSIGAEVAGDTPMVVWFWEFPQAWSEATGILGTGDTTSVAYQATRPVPLGPGESLYLTVNTTGLCEVTFFTGFGGELAKVLVDGAGTLEVESETADDDTSFTPGLTPHLPYRVQVEVRGVWSGENWAGVRARARSAHGAAWSAWATASLTPAAIPGVGAEFGVVALNTGSVSGLTLAVDTHADDWMPPATSIPALGGWVRPWLPADVRSWDGLQEACAAWMAAGWVTRDGRLIVRDRHWLTGVGRTPETVQVADVVEDVAWTSDPADTADRVVVTYNPADAVGISTNDHPPTLWQAPDAIEVGGGQTVEIVADLSSQARYLLHQWSPAWTPGVEEHHRSIWGAMPSRDGSGTQPADEALAVTSRRISAGRVLVTIRNNTGGTLYTVDANGQPCLILRALEAYPQENQVTIERGTSEAAAENPVTVDLGRYVQTRADADVIADYVWARVRTPMWKASSVRILPNLDRDLGDVVQLVHPDSDLDVKALVTKVALSGGPGELTQHLDLVLLPTTVADLDAEWAGLTVGEFDNAHPGLTVAEFDDRPLAIGA